MLVAEVFRRCLGLSTNLYAWRHLEELADELRASVSGCLEPASMISPLIRADDDGLAAPGLVEAIRWAALRGAALGTGHSCAKSSIN